MKRRAHIQSRRGWLTGLVLLAASLALLGGAAGLVPSSAWAQTVPAAEHELTAEPAPMTPTMSDADRSEIAIELAVQTALPCSVVMLEAALWPRLRELPLDSRAAVRGGVVSLIAHGRYVTIRYRQRERRVELGARRAASAARVLALVILDLLAPGGPTPALHALPPVPQLPMPVPTSDDRSGFDAGSARTPSPALPLASNEPSEARQVSSAVQTGFTSQDSATAPSSAARDNAALPATAQDTAALDTAARQRGAVRGTVPDRAASNPQPANANVLDVAATAAIEVPATTSQPRSSVRAPGAGVRTQARPRAGSAALDLGLALGTSIGFEDRGASLRSLTARIERDLGQWRTHAGVGWLGLLPLEREQVPVALNAIAARAMLGRTLGPVTVLVGGFAAPYRATAADHTSYGAMYGLAATAEVTVSLSDRLRAFGAAGADVHASQVRVRTLDEVLLRTPRVAAALSIGLSWRIQP